MRPQPSRKVQPAITPPKRPDTDVTKFARWPQPLAIIPIATYLRHDNPKLEVEILDANKVISLANTVEFLKRISQFDTLDRLEWGSLIPFPGSRANRTLREHPGLAGKHKHFGDANYTDDLLRMPRDWYRRFCKIDFDDIQALQDKVAQDGLVPYELTAYQRRSWSRTPGKVFLDGKWTASRRTAATPALVPILERSFEFLPGPHRRAAVVPSRDCEGADNSRVTQYGGNGPWRRSRGGSTPAARAAS